MLGGDAVPDTDSGSLFHFSHYCRMGHFRGFIRISDTATAAFHEMQQNDWHWVWINLDSGNPDSNSGSLL